MLNSFISGLTGRPKPRTDFEWTRMRPSARRLHRALDLEGNVDALVDLALLDEAALVVGA